MSAMGYFERFADEQFAKDGGAVLAGLLASEAGAGIVAGKTVPVADYQIKNDGTAQAVTGASVIVTSQFAPVGGRAKRMAQLGGAVGGGLGLADKFGLRSALPGMGGN